MLSPNLLILPFFFSPLFAWAHTPEEGKIVATIGPFVHRTHADPEPTQAGSPIQGGAALIVEGDVDNNGGLEIAFFYLNKNYYREDAGRVQVDRATRAYVTMGYRHWFNEKISAAGAVFSGYTMGDPVTVHSDFPRGLAPDTTAGEKTEYGLDFSIQYELWKEARYSAVSDFRYSASLTGKPHEDANHYGIFLGLRYLIQEK